MSRTNRRSLLGTESLSPEEIQGLLRLARRMQSSKPRPLLRDKRVVLLFYEASTRTRVSFEFAAKSLGAQTALVTATASSIEKGESVVDTGYTVRALGADCVVMRHPASGAPHLMARHLDVPVINAGDGMHEHPTQALLDAYTILKHKPKIAGLKIVIVGDVYHSRVARSAVYLLSKLGAQLTLCGPPELCPEVAATLSPSVTVTRHLEGALRQADVIMMLRVQKERLGTLQLRLDDYITYYQLTAERLRLARREAIVMHPGPMVRGLEITAEVADGPQSVIREQVANGVYVRMAALATVMGAA